MIEKLRILQIEDLVEVVQYGHDHEEGDYNYQGDLTFFNILGIYFLLIARVEIKQVHTDKVDQRDKREYRVLVVRHVDSAFKRHENHHHNCHVIVKKDDLSALGHFLQVDEQIVAQ